MDTDFVLILSGAVCAAIVITYFVSWIVWKRSHVKRMAFEALHQQCADLQLQHASLQQQHNDLQQQHHTLQQQLVQVQTAHAMLTQNNEQQLQQLQEQKTRLDNKSLEFIAVSNEASRRKAEIEGKQREVSQLQQEKATLEQKLESVQQLWQEASAKATQWQSQHEALAQRLKEQQVQMQQYGEQLKKEFQLLADGVLQAKAAQFNHQQETKLNDLLNPVRQKLEEFKADIALKFSGASTERTELKEQVRLMAELNQKLSKQAENLTKALSSQVKQQGNWGEEILETILQHVGLQKDIHYFAQFTSINDNGQTIRPDFVVRYPDDRYVVVDSKVSLVSYQRMMDTEQTEEQQAQLSLLVRSVRQHIDGLAGKQYQHIAGTLDYVLLFIPVEGAFITAMQADHNLWKYAYDKKIMLLSPTLLLSAMKLIHELWKQNDVNRNAAQMADRAGKLYDKLANFVENFENAGKKLDEAAKSFSDARGQLYTGRGNALQQAQQMKKLGARTTKRMTAAAEEAATLFDNGETESLPLS